MLYFVFSKPPIEKFQICQTNILTNVYVAVFVIVSQQLILKVLSANIALIAGELQVLPLLR